MKNASVHDILIMMGEMRKLDMHKDRLSRLIDNTLHQVEDAELCDDEMEFVAAAHKPEDADNQELFSSKKRR